MFTERSDLVADDDPVRGYGVAVTPGREGPLVFVAGYGEPNRLYARDGDRFVDTACGIVADGTRHGMGVCAADLDADGCEEVYVHNCTKGVDGGGDPDLLLSRLESERYRWTDLFALDVNADRLDVRAGRSVAALDRLETGRYGVAVSGYAAPSPSTKSATTARSRTWPTRSGWRSTGGVGRCSRSRTVRARAICSRR